MAEWDAMARPSSGHRIPFGHNVLDFLDHLEVSTPAAADTELRQFSRMRGFK